MNSEIMQSLIAIILMALSAAPYTVFTQALEMCIKGQSQLSGKDITKAYIGFRLANRTRTSTMEYR